MRRFTSIFPLLVILCFTFEAQAQYQGYCGQQNTELAVMLQTQDDIIEVTVWYADGTVLLPPTMYTWADRPAPETHNCVLTIGTADGAGGGDIDAPEQIVTIKLRDVVGGGTYRFSTTTCAGAYFDEVDDGFICPPIFWNGSSGGDSDIWIVFSEGGFHLVPQGIRDAFGPGKTHMGLDDVLHSSFILPYDNDIVCGFGVCGNDPSWASHFNVFLTRQGEEPTPNDFDFILGNWTVPEGETWYWHLYGNTLLAGGQREVRGTLELSDLTMAGQDPLGIGGSFPWGGFDITDTGTVRIVGDVTLDLPDFVDVEGVFSVEGNGDLTAIGGDYRFANGLVLAVKGTLDADDVLFTELSPGLGWGGIFVKITGTMQISGDVTIDEPDLVDVAGDFQIPAGGDLTAVGGTYRFAGGKSLRAYGRLTADDVIFTELYPGDGWYGVQYEPDGGGNLHGVTIEKFGHVYQQGELFAPAVCGLTVNDRWLAVYRSFIQDGFNGADGVCSAGDQAQIALRDENTIRSEVSGNDGDGLRATNQGRFLVRNADIFENGGNGGTSIGTGANIYAWGSTFSFNGGVGLASLSDGNVLLYDPNGSGDGDNTLDGNDGGGLLAQSQGSYINAGTYLNGLLGPCANACNNFILNHEIPLSPFDAKAANNSLIFAEYDHWGEGRTTRNDLDLLEIGGGIIQVDPIWDGTSLRGGPVAMRSTAEPSGFRETVRGLIVKALEKAAEGQWEAALAHAQTAVAMASGEDEIGMAMGAVSALLGRPDAPDMPPGLLVAIEAHLGTGQQGRPYGLRALLSAHRARDRDGDARAVALALLAEYPNTEHGLVGLAQEVDLALEVDEIAAAQAALATMEADFPDELLTETTRAYFVLVAGEDALPARTAATSMATGGTTNASTNAQARGFVLHAAYPNPFNPQAVVPFSVGSVAHVEITVFDMLGRRVATLVDSRYEAGVYDTVFDGAELPSGMYLVRANVTPENGGGTTAFTQRVTLLK